MKITEKRIYELLNEYREKQAQYWERAGKKVYHGKDSMDFLEKVCNPTSAFATYLIDNLK